MMVFGVPSFMSCIYFCFVVCSSVYDGVDSQQQGKRHSNCQSVSYNIQNVMYFFGRLFY